MQISFGTVTLSEQFAALITSRGYHYNADLDRFMQGDRPVEWEELVALAVEELAEQDAMVLAERARR